LMPLRIAQLGGSGLLVGATFLVASLVSTQLSRPIGRATDRRGPRSPLLIGLTATAVLMALLTLPTSPLLLGLVTVVVFGAPLTAYTVPAITILTDGSERAGIQIVVASMVLNLAWALGEALGAPAAAGLAQASSDAVPLLGLAALMVATLVPVIRARMPAPAAAARPEAGDATLAPVIPAASESFAAPSEATASRR
ncbi:MAG: hypothetical protein ACRDL5_09820, partial [Solirubrobacteraceae bacterium]